MYNLELRVNHTELGLAVGSVRGVGRGSTTTWQGWWYSTFTLHRLSPPSNATIQEELHYIENSPNKAVNKKKALLE